METELLRDKPKQGLAKTQAAAIAAAGHQRAHGAMKIAYVKNRDGAAVLNDLYQRAPCRVLFPDIDAGEAAQAVLLTTSGGLTGGDRLEMEAAIDAGCRVTLTTQAAEKLYRALPEDADTRIDVRVRVGNGAWLEWLAQETILFDRARLRRSFSAELEAGARLLAVESIVFGRTAMGETYASGRLHDSWRIRRGGRLVWADATMLDGDIATLRVAPLGFGTAVAYSTLIYASEDAPQLLAPVRELLEQHYGRAAATAFAGLLVIRLMADDASVLRATVINVASWIRQAAAGLPPKLPRVWHC